MWLKSFFDPLYRWLTDYMGACGFILYGGGKGDAPAPDPRMGEAALRQIALAEKQWEEYSKEGGDRDWLRDITDRAISTYEDTQKATKEMSEYQLGQAQRRDNEYWNETVPYRGMVDDNIERLYSQDGIQNQVNNATADVNAAMSNTRAQAERGLTRMGVNPNSGAFSNMANATSLQQATAMASAANKTRTAAEQAGLASRFQSLGAKLGLAGLGATNAGLATSALGTGLSAAGGMTGAAANNIGTNNATFGTTMSGMSQGISGYGNYVGLQQNATKINNDADPFTSLLGAGAQMGAAWLGKTSDRRLKADIVLVGKDERTGLNLYEFRYVNGDKRFRGVMADEVEVLYPEAVFTMPDGYKAVNYALLGIDMVLAEGETA